MEMNGAMAEAARAAIGSCHAPYSGFRVSSVLEDLDGCLHTGVNVENASYGLSICAERAAVAGAVSHGAKEFRRILVYSPDGRAVPCGACRQVLAEFCGDATPVAILLPDGGIEETTLGALIPDAFRLGSFDA